MKIDWVDSIIEMTNPVETKTTLDGRVQLRSSGFKDVYHLYLDQRHLGLAVGTTPELLDARVKTMLASANVSL